MHAFQNTVTIARPVGEVFAFLADLRNIPRWNYAVARTVPTSPSPAEAGATYRLPGMDPNGRYMAGETTGRRSSLPGNWPEEGTLSVVLVTGSGRPAARRAAVPAQCPRARNALRRLAAIKAPGSVVDRDPGGSCTVVTAGHPPGSRELSWA
jgi:polyketide cyclase/dehydrase/lipid transport protein